MSLKEEQLIQKIIPKIEKKLTSKITQKVMDMVYEEFYPPESMLKKSFVKSVDAASKRLGQGKGKLYSYREFKNKFLGKK